MDLKSIPYGSVSGSHRSPDFDRFSPEALFTGGGELGQLMSKINWSETPLGPVEQWPQNLKTCVRIVLTSRQPMFVWWGDELINLYNDAYKAIVGGKHPVALGQPARIVWREIWDQIGPRAESAMRENEGTYDEALLLIMERYGYREETYYTFSYSPVPNDQGGTGGIFCANSDDTQRIISERQLSVLGDLAARTADAKTWQEACRLSAMSLATDPRDFCFSLIYVVDDNKKLAILAGASGIDLDHPAAPNEIPIGDERIWPIALLLNSHEIRIVKNLNNIESLPSGAWDCGPHTAAVVPIPISGPTGRAGVVIVGLNPYRQLDNSYTKFLKLTANQISTSIANAEAYENERRRAESLAELDRARTTFFSNVSHEFRTPLTLMLGPLENMLSESKDDAHCEHLAQIEIVHRNGLRLLRLVNTLLDFSRIEAGRVQAVYQPIDLSAATAELASVFRSAMEAAGLEFIISCKPLSQPVYIDSEMWEKIVSNLLSNALKFTISGAVEVTLSEANNYAQLSVRDTGVGIPETELPRVFERFHRIEGTRGRTHEGTGIGLALVDELVRLHGGNVLVESQCDAGTIFTIQIPFGSKHLATGRIVEAAQAPASTLGVLPYIQEAMRWLPSTASDSQFLLKESANQDLTFLHGQEANHSQTARIVLADDNRDMREYVARLLAQSYQVTAVEDGQQALAAIRENPPDLVLSDVMMPGIDGFGILKEIRSNPATATIPVILLSARAGEEARSEGMEAGADDYLVKPFTARELMARIGAHIKMHKLRSQLMKEEHELRLVAEKAESKYRMILDSISEGFIFVGRDWRINYINDQAAFIAGFQSRDLIGKTMWGAFPELKHTVFGRAYRKAIESGEVQRVEDFYAPINRWLHANIYSTSEGLSIFIQDVSEQRRQQEQLLTTEKLAATGRLAATIAHEINNPLEAVLNLLYLARISRSASPESIHQYLLTAEQELTRVSQIARHTLGFYRDTSVPLDIELSRILEEVLSVYRSRLAAARIEVVKKFDPVPLIHALRGELNQVFSNLISNAIDAMREGGRLVVQLSALEHDRRNGIEVIIEDNGCGIDSIHRKKLFEPFFTTKVSVGTGLGLWVVKQFIENHGGTVSVWSSVDSLDHGTRFTIFLPSDTMIATKQHLM